MKDRIIQFLRETNLTSTKFADIIGVQRSSISHLLSGRNKPSFDFIEKMLAAYPNLNAQWLITGKGNMFINQTTLFNETNEPKTETLSQRELNIQEISEDDTIKSNSEAIKDDISNENEIISSLDSEIEQIIIFFKNGSFKTYKPK